VQGRKGEMTGLGHGQRRLDGLEVAHLTDQHHVRILAQDVLERSAEAHGIGAHLALVDQAALVRVQVLDGILDGDDVLVPLRVDPVDDAGQSGGLPGSGRAGHQDQAAWPLGELARDPGKPQLFEGLDLVGDGSESTRHRATLIEDVGAEPREAPNAKGEIELTVFLEAMLLGVGENRVAELLGLWGRQRRHLERMQFAVDPELGRAARGDVKIAAALFDHRFEELMQIRHRE